MVIMDNSALSKVMRNSNMMNTRSEVNWLFEALGDFQLTECLTKHFECPIRLLNNILEKFSKSNLTLNMYLV